MLLLLFRLGENRYAIDTADIAEIVPMVLLTKIPAAPAHIAGVFNYHSSIVPVIDLCQLIRGTACQACYSTRVVIVNSIAGAAEVEPTRKGDRQFATRLLGLMAERVTETLKISEDYLGNAQQISTVPYLSEPFLDEQGMIQQVHWQYLVSEAHQAALLTEGGNQANGAGRN
ncbi:chemotaxis protein CheW [Microcoleus sp. FACHB-1515]|uniref:chemotaxis protein CheW n=1 Tax=Cyanophyceae TaxID=3028117 RepID=UPI0016823677|nr:chemotaxis protein CheW [Microcoleus sp. FACHB-1515]MBD2090937.1 chemotaxis protein CheW [Microcoleus sp. FACHB-1515]